MATLNCDRRRRQSHRHKNDIFLCKATQQLNTIFTWFSIRFYIFLSQISEFYNLPGIDTTCHHRENFIRKTHLDASRNKSLCHWRHTVTNNILSLGTWIQNNTHTPMPGVTDSILTLCLSFPSEILEMPLMSFLASTSAYTSRKTSLHWQWGISYWVACSHHAATVQPA